MPTHPSAPVTDPARTPGLRLAELTTTALAARLGRHEVVVLVPVGSVEPHGPHLPLATDTLIGEAVAEGAAAELARRGTDALVAPSVAYGVTEFARGFAGAVSVANGTLTALLARIATSLVGQGFRHVCFVSQHLEPAHEAEVRAAVTGLPHGSASVASPLSRRWGRLLSDEFKSGACHAGEYETSLVLAIAPELCDQERAATLAPLAVSLSDSIRAGKTSFAECGMPDAYTGAPARATAAHGREMLARLVALTVAEVEQALATATTRPPPSDLGAR
ncbi:MAG: creatininase family protein [Myxococcales bacterium]|nr:creatininase family protein [Myxococcales bacterium]